MDFWDFLFVKILRGEEVPVDDAYSRELIIALRVKDDYESLLRAAEHRIDQIHNKYANQLDSK